MLEDILLQVNKPARYIGQEWNASRKDFAAAQIRFALCFPDLYEVGMSNFGMRILYGLLNGMADVACERFFHPALDLESLLRSKGEKIFSLESRRGLADFDLVGFSLGYELNYTNVLNILDLAGIPLLSSERGQDLPIVIAGGSCCLNPEPLAEFFDLFVIGEAEEAIVEIVDVYRNEKKKAGNKRPHKKELLYALAQIEGVYVPAFYRVDYNAQGAIKSFAPASRGIPSKIKKRFIRNLDDAFFPVEWMVPYSQIIHDRITLEIMRGCPNRCRFCQARTLYAPYRHRAAEKIIDLAKKIYAVTGYEDISLLGLSVSDYYKIKELTQQLLELFKKEAVSVSLPSIKPKDNTKDLLALITQVKKTGLTLAPEVATQRLRKIINKDFSEQDFFSTIEHAYKLGYQHVKLYFMIGWPWEEKEDLDGILNLARQVSELKLKVEKRPAQVNLSVATFIPKPHTPFQWLRMEGLESIANKQAYLKSEIKKSKSRLVISFHNRHMGFVEGVLSRGDRKISRVILEAWRQGAKFDAWDEYFSFEAWMRSFQSAGIDPHFYLSRAILKEENLPWDFIDTGIEKEDLLAEFAQCAI